MGGGANPNVGDGVSTVWANPNVGDGVGYGVGMGVGIGFESVGLGVESGVPSLTETVGGIAELAIASTPR
jgi:hypothetical protein